MEVDLGEGALLATNKRLKLDSEDTMAPAKVVDYSDVYSLSNVLDDEGGYGSVGKEYQALRDQVMHLRNSYAPATPFAAGKEDRPANDVIDLDLDDDNDAGQKMLALSTEELKAVNGNDTSAVIVVDSDEEDEADLGPVLRQASYFHTLPDPSPLYPLSHAELRVRSDIFQRVSLVPVIDRPPVPALTFSPVLLGSSPNQGTSGELDHGQQQWTNSIVPSFGGNSGKKPSRVKSPHDQQRKRTYTPRCKAKQGEKEGGKKPAVIGDDIGGEGQNIEHNIEGETGDMSCTTADTGYHSPRNQNNQETSVKSDDGLDDLWRDMSMAMEVSKDAALVDEPAPAQDEEIDDCNHKFQLHDDVGLVCVVCGVVKKSIENIFDYQWTKGNQSTRTYARESRDSNLDEVGKSGKITEHLLIGADISVHPRHMKQMKQHQIEGFNFLVKNLLADPPGGCILAHAPGSGKTFMLISFIQSFMAKDTNARPLVVLPKGILSTWRREFQRWQVEDIPLYDFYSAKADNRSQQLEILNIWHEKRSILLLGYKQFSNIICEGAGNKVTAACQDILLRVPTLLILDEGHNPRNDNTDMVGSLAKVRTPCKVVLSGTLFQNNVEEVFNILKLVRPNFMKAEASRIAMKRIRSMGIVPSGKRATKGNSESHFYDLVEETLRNDDNYRRRIQVIQELREMTRQVLHYYKGDSLDELPGLVDFTVLFNLTMKQKDSIKKLGKLEKFTKSSREKNIYMHPQLGKVKENASDKDTKIDVEKVDNLINSIDLGDGVKAKFFMNLVSMAASCGEKVLVFSQYLLPLKFLERLLVLKKGWRFNTEIFLISGESSTEDRERSMELFNNSPDAKILFGSIKACGEGISLVGGSRILILDVHLNPSVTRQAIGRAFRPGQEKKVYVYRLVAADSQEEDDHGTSFRKELISKLWFEWSEYCGTQDFDLEPVDIKGTEDIFLDNYNLTEDIKTIYRR